MNAFFKAAEVWVPSKNSAELEIASSDYGEFTNFAQSSVDSKLKYNMGLAGKAWSGTQPLILTDLNTDNFERAELAHEAGITMAIAIPAFAGDCLLGVLVLFHGSESSNDGTVEVWHCDARNSFDLSLRAGYFGDHEQFEKLTKSTQFRQGVGLPGQCWETGKPVMMNELGKSKQFIRSQGAAHIGMTFGLGVPFLTLEDQVYVTAFLSSSMSPIAKQVEIWTQDEGDGFLKFESGYSATSGILAGHYSGTVIAKGEGVLGTVCLTGTPQICKELSSDHQIETTESDDNLTSVIAFPVLQNGRCQSVVAMYS